MSCEWHGCDRPPVGWHFWPGSDNPWDAAKPGWRYSPWLRTCGYHFARRRSVFVLAA